MEDWCEWAFDNFDGFTKLFVLLFCMPLILCILLGWGCFPCCSLFCMRTSYSLLLSWQVWGGMLFNFVYLRYACPNNSYLDYPMGAYVSLAFALTALFLSWKEGLAFLGQHVLSSEKDPDFQHLSPDEARTLIGKLISNQQTDFPIEMTYRVHCYYTETKAEWAEELQYNHTTKRHEWYRGYRYVTHTHDVFSQTDEFKYDQAIDATGEIPDLPLLKPGDCFKVKINQEIIPGDEFTEKQIKLWKERFENWARQEGERHDTPMYPTYDFTEKFEIKNVRPDWLVKAEGAAPWFLNGWIVFILGFLCLLWIINGFVSLGLKNLQIDVKKKVFIRQQKYFENV